MWLPLGLLLLRLAGLVESVDADTYKKVGGKAILSPGPVSGPITSVTWKHGADIAVELYGEELKAYRDFKGRCEVDTTTGALTISNLTLKDSGSYTAEVNNRVMTTTEIKVIATVPKPTISTHCNPEETRCTLTCEASIPETTGAVTYSWTIGEAVKPPATKQLDITRDDAESVGKPISCQLENPVSRERSDVIMSPFTNGTSGSVIALAVVSVLYVLVALMALVHYVIWRKNRPEGESAGCRQYVAWLRTRRCLNCGRTEGTAGGGATLAQEQRNGAGTPQGTREEATPLVPIQNGGATFSLDNETHTRGSSDATNETPETLSGVPETPAQDPTPVELPNTPSDPKVPKTTSGDQEELDRDQTAPGSAETSSRSGDLTDKSAVKQESEEEEEEAT